MHRLLHVQRRTTQVTAGSQQQTPASLTQRHRPHSIHRSGTVLEGIQHRLCAVELAKRDQRIECIREEQ
jgi:hypothetical protein